MRPGFATRRRQSNENAVRNTESQNQTVPGVPVLSTRSPTIAAARSGLVKRDKIDSAMVRLCMSVQVPTAEQYDSRQTSERIYRAYVYPFYPPYPDCQQTQGPEDRLGKERRQRPCLQKARRLVANQRWPEEKDNPDHVIGEPVWCVEPGELDQE